MGINKIQGVNIYLGPINREQLKQYFEEIELDFDTKTDYLHGFGWPTEGVNEIYDNMKKKHGDEVIGLGIYKNGGTLIGDITLHNISWQNRSAEVGITIAYRSDRGMGYGAEAIRLILQHAFNNLGLDRVGISTLEHNIGCRKAVEKNGMVLEGVNRKAAYIAGKYYDKVLYSILRDEYKK